MAPQLFAVPPLAAALMITAYGFFWGLQGAAQFDVHTLTFAPGLIALMLLSLDRLRDPALDALDASGQAKQWMGPVFHNAYLIHKRGELAGLEGLDEKAQCDLYAETY